MGGALRRLSTALAIGLSLAVIGTAGTASADGSALQTLINQDRASNGGLPPLIWSPCLANIALQNAQRIANQGYLSHTNGPTLDLGCGNSSTQAGENIAYISSGIDDNQVNTMYMNSAPHRANILGAYNYVGTAWVIAPNGYGYNAEEFLAASSLLIAAPSITGLSAGFGPTCGGTSVIISGRAFTGATSVKFGATNALTFAVNSDSQITAISPAGAAAVVDIAVTTPAGSSTAVAADQFTFSTSAPSTPVIAALQPNTTPVYGGTAVSIIGGCLSGTSAVRFGSMAGASVANISQNQVNVTAPAAAAATVDLTLTASAGTSAVNAADHFTFVQGYWMVARDGGIFTYGNTPFKGSTGGIILNKPVVGMARTPSDGGYWLVASDGGIFTFGDAPFKGSTGAISLNKPIVGMASTPSGQGYWLVGSDGGIFTFGDAGMYGSTGSITLNQPIVGMAATPTGHGYWLVASDGGIFTFGDAPFKGSTGGISLNKPIVGMASTPSGQGYWLVASDGGIFSFGDAAFDGSTGGITLNQPIVGMAATRSGKGYWLVASDGGIFTFGDAVFQGSAGGIRLNQPIVGMSAG
jgi:hypothetical protein